MMEVSNTAFFPAYPAIAWILHRAIGVGVENALLITAQSAAWGFWTYFFLFLRTMELPASWQLLGALLILAHPAAFFLVAGYSESLFLMALLGFLYWSGMESRRARILAGTSRHRHVGDPDRRPALCAGTTGEKDFGSSAGANWQTFAIGWANYGGAALVSASAMLGGLGFSFIASSGGGTGTSIC